MRTSRRREGFSMIELLIVCAIIGVLAAIAIPAFRGQVMRARASEGPEVLAAIRAAQESYYALYSRYCGPLDWNPATFAAPEQVGSFDESAWGWSDLGVDPGRAVRFRYQVNAGVPGTRPPPQIAGYNQTEHWYTTQAEADLDGDGTSIVFEGYSISTRFYPFSRHGGTDGPYLAAEWE